MYYGKEDYARIIVPLDCIPKGAKLVEAYETEHAIIICGDPPNEPEGLTEEERDAYYETAHNCDAMGCGTLSHVIYRFQKDVQPIDMLLACPCCGKSHVDAPEPEKGWTNPPHKSRNVLECTNENANTSETGNAQQSLDESL